MTFTTDIAIQSAPDRVFILRCWQEDQRVWRAQATDENKTVLGWAEGSEQICDLIHELLNEAQRMASGSRK